MILLAQSIVKVFVDVDDDDVDLDDGGDVDEGETETGTRSPDGCVPTSTCPKPGTETAAVVVIRSAGVFRTALGGEMMKQRLKPVCSKTEGASNSSAA